MFSLDTVKKFQLEQNSELKCKYHGQINAEFKCPICSSSICRDCFRILKIKDKFAFKGICKSCNLRLNIKIMIFMLVLIYFLYRFYKLELFSGVIGFFQR